VIASALQHWANENAEVLFRLEELRLEESGSALVSVSSANGDKSILASGVQEISLTRKRDVVPTALRLSSEHPLLADYGKRASLFGRAPLPDPYRFFLEFHKLVRDQFGIEREPLRYLNYKGRMSEWLAMVYSRTFNLLSGPSALVEAAAELLDAQVAEYTLLPDPSPELAVSLLEMGKFWIIAERFEADEPTP